jgi:hypothetical protein
MESSSLFNPGFLGGSFYWFIGQIADDSRYRYKVRIIGQHEQDESEVTAEDLPWAQVMYPVTSGSGQGGSYQSPALKQGMFVFGFFLDGKDQQTPIIMGCLGNNAKTKLERKTGTEGSGGKNFTPQSFYSKNQDEEPEPQKHLKDGDLAPKQGGNNVTIEASDANNIKTIADRKKYGTLIEKHPLACPNPDTQSDTKNIQTVISTLTNTIESFQQSLTDADAAVGLPILKNDKNIDKAIENASEEMAKYMKGTMNKLQQFTTKEFNEKLAPMENLAPPSHSLELLNKKVEGLEKIACMFNGMAGLALAGLIAAALRRAFNRKKRRAEEAAANSSVSNAGVVNATLAAGIGTDGLIGTDAVVGGTDTLTGTIGSRVGITSSQTIPSTPVLDTPGATDVPPPTADGFYRPTPLCETEEIVGEVMGGTINTIMSGFDGAIGPVIDEIQNSLGGSSTETGSENVGTIDHAINENNVLSSLSSGALILSFSQSVADQAGIDPNNVGNSNRYWADGNYGLGLVGFIDAADQNTPDNQQLIAQALSLIDDRSNPTGIAAGLTLASNILGVNQNLLGGIGLAFAAIRGGGIPDLISAVGGLAAFNPRILNAVAGGGAALGGGALASGIGLGALGGMSFDIASALNFVNSITKIFNCDPEPECSPNDEHTMQSGGGSAGRPSTSSIAESAKNSSLSIKEKKSYGTSVEKLSSSKEGVKIKKTFAKPRRSR